jgi:hypothetical protein
MPKVILKRTAASDAAIAADAGRTYLEFCAETFAEVRWCFGATFVEADSQSLPVGLIRPFEGALAQQAFSFSAGQGSIAVTTLP